MVFYYRRFGTTYWTHLQGSSSNIHMHAVAALAKHELLDGWPYAQCHWLRLVMVL